VAVAVVVGGSQNPLSARQQTPTASPPADPPLADPRAIVEQSLGSLAHARSFHFEAVVSGRLTASDGPAAQGGSIDLAGTTASGDVDVANDRFRATLGAPTLMGLAGDLVIVGPMTYLRVNLLGPMYRRDTGVDPAPTIASLIDALAQRLTAGNRSMARQPTVPCGREDCYHVTLRLAPEDVAPILEAVFGETAPGSGGSLDLLAQTSDGRPTEVTASVDTGSGGSISIRLVLSGYDAPVAVVAPPDNEVELPASPTP